MDPRSVFPPSFLGPSGRSPPLPAASPDPSLRKTAGEEEEGRDIKDGEKEEEEGTKASSSLLYCPSLHPPTILLLLLLGRYLPPRLLSLLLFCPSFLSCDGRSVGLRSEEGGLCLKQNCVRPFGTHAQEVSPCPPYFPRQKFKRGKYSLSTSFGWTLNSSFRRFGESDSLQTGNSGACPFFTLLYAPPPSLPFKPDCTFLSSPQTVLPFLGTFQVRTNSQSGTTQREEDVTRV